MYLLKWLCQTFWSGSTLPQPPSCCNSCQIVERNDIPCSIVANVNVVVCCEYWSLLLTSQLRHFHVLGSVTCCEENKWDLAEKWDLMLHVCFFFFYVKVIFGVMLFCELKRHVWIHYWQSDECSGLTLTSIWLYWMQCECVFWAAQTKETPPFIRPYHPLWPQWFHTLSPISSISRLETHCLKRSKRQSLKKM